MSRLALASVVLLSASWVSVGFGETAAPTHQVQLNGQTFTLPTGFEIEQVAGPPLVDRPIMADFDEQGQLYVADSSGSNEPVQVQLQKKPHRILRLEDSDGDGRFDRRTIFADRMMFPEGVLWNAGSVYVSGAPSIWKLTDTKGNGVADQRIEWFQGKTLTGCANDLHGPYLGPDGWIYWCKGAFAKQTYERPGRPPFVTRAAHIFRCRLDGSGIEPVMNGGMDNPVEVVFTPGGERIFTTTFFQHPGGGQRDGLIHAIYGGVYGKDHDPIYEHPWTSPSLMPVMTHLGPAAPCGLVRYESEAFGPAYRDNLFACLFNMHKVTRHVLVPDGATFKTRDEDFLVSSNVDFHPTDVLEDADGSLLVIDTGGWYKICCPTSWLHKPDVLGAIYRIRRKGMTRPDSDPRGLKLAWTKISPQELGSLLGDPRPAVRRRAIQALAELGGNAVPVLSELLHSPGTGVVARRNAIWSATRIGDTAARGVARSELADSDETTRQVAIHSVSLWRDHDALPEVLSLLKGPSLQNRRAAAEAIGRIGDKTAIPALLQAVGTPNDRALSHSLTYALIEIGDPEATATGLRSPNPLIRRAALTALDQMPGSRLQTATVAQELASPDARMRETPWWIAGRHPEWGGALAGYLRERLTATLSSSERDELIHHLARFARAAPVQKLLAERLGDPATSREGRQTVLRAMAQAGLKQVPSAWITGLTEAMTAKDSDVVSEAVSTARVLQIPAKQAAKLTRELLALAHENRCPVQVRLTALAAVPGGLSSVDQILFELLVNQLTPEQPVANRGTAADVLARARLSLSQLSALADVLKAVSPLEMDRLLEAFAQSTDEAVGRKLVAALKALPSRSSLRIDALKPLLAKFPTDVQHEAEELYAALDVDAAKQRSHLEQMLGSLKEGDPRRGQAIFYSSKASCSACHAIGYLGGNVGPDLTQIGKIRTERDLLESIVFPSATIVRSYEPVLITTKDGKFHNGLIRKELPDELILATGPNQEERLARGAIEEVQPSKVSVMPAGLDQQLTVRELADLVAFLKACK
jgi:putative membrane-bound dehydrogenase-like protein